MEKVTAEWHSPTLGITCPHCGEWNNYQDQNEGDGDGWIFPPCESKSKKEIESRYSPVVFKCPEKNCLKEFEVEEVSW